MDATPLQSSCVWRALGSSVRGSAHTRKGLVNQDALHWFPEYGKGPPLILSVADGHGSSLSFRSSTGSHFATLAIEAALNPFILQIEQSSEEEIRQQGSFIKDQAKHELPDNIQNLWRHLVALHYKQNPFTEAEINGLASEVERNKAKRVKEEGKYFLAYGTTLLAVLVTQYFIIYVQLGDGDILTIMEDGSPFAPMPKDSRLIANETTSLCQDNAAHDIQVNVQILQSPQLSPALILLSTDGFKNSFKSENDYLLFGTDIFNKFKSESIKSEISKVESNLKNWLDEISRGGSGDDVTLGILCRIGAFDKQG